MRNEHRIKSDTTQSFLSKMKKPSTCFYTISFIFIINHLKTKKLQLILIRLNTDALDLRLTLDLIT